MLDSAVKERAQLNESEYLYDIEYLGRLEPVPEGPRSIREDGKDLFAWIDPRFGPDKRGQSRKFKQQEGSVRMYELVNDASFMLMLKSLYRQVESLAFAQEQLLAVVAENKEMILEGERMVFMPFIEHKRIKDTVNLIRIAGIYPHGKLLLARWYPYDYQRTWSFKKGSRLIIRVDPRFQEIG